MNREEKARKFRELHKNGLFLLPNAWNGGSAKVFENEGFDAIGTTSAGIAYSMGMADGEVITFEDLYRAVKEILRVTNVPISVDMERGYSEDILKIKENVRRIVELGAVGINIEDGIPSKKEVDDIKLFVDKIKAISDLRNELGFDFVINARVDTYLLKIYETDILLEKTINRVKVLENAGVDCIFIPGALDEDTIIKLRKEIKLPINLYLHKKFNNLDKLREIGINRLSSGSAPVRTIFQELITLAGNFQDNEVSLMLDHNFNYDCANKYFSKR